MKIVKGIAGVLAVGLVVIQFVRPARIGPPAENSQDFVRQLHPPQEVEHLLRVACYDCHSNETRYPWYAELQPVGWWLESHVEEARKELNFSEFGSYHLRRRFIKIQKMGEEVEQGEMPIASYLALHSDARFSTEQKELFVRWVNATRDSIAANAPPDSLARRR